MTAAPSTLKIRSIFLLESNFKRSPNVTIDGAEIFGATMEVHAGEVKDEEDTIFSDLIVNSEVRYKDQIQAEAKVRMVGIFKTENASPDEKKKFAFINCPAIIFPFIREQIASLYAKSGLKPYMLDPVNFVKLVDEQQPIQRNTEVKQEA